MNKITVSKYGTTLGNLLVFVSIFLPWYHGNIYGAEKIYTGFYLASVSMAFWVLYLLPLLSGIVLAGYILHHFNREITLTMLSPKILIFSLSVIMIIIIFVVLTFTPAGIMSPVMNNLCIGGYTAITGALLSLIFSAPILNL